MTNKAIQPIPGGTVTSPLGFAAGATYCGLKSKGDDPKDLGILSSEAPCVAAGVFTRNRIKAAPVIVSREHLAGGKARAIVVNSGCANACTGEQGMKDARAMASLTARKLGVPAEQVLVASTGVIGVTLPMKQVEGGIARVATSRDGGHELARAIMTTDTVSKEIAVSVDLGDGKVTVGGIAKGAGMIHPNLATMLVFLTTDARVGGDFLAKALRRAVGRSFNMISVDGDTSTNDSVFLLASGRSRCAEVASGQRAALFQSALDHVCMYLAKRIVNYGEGATTLIEATVGSARTPADARKAARAIIGSLAVKTAVHGKDPNWGRIAVAVGQSGAAAEMDKLDIYLGDTCLMAHGQPQPFDRPAASQSLRLPEVQIRVELGLGRAQATAWGCDLSEEYVTLNAEYTT